MLSTGPGRVATTLALLVLGSLLAAVQTTAQQPTPFTIPSNMEVWETSFLTLPGLWQSLGNGSLKGIWINGAVAELTVERFDTEAVIINRTDKQGLTPGIRARYVGKIVSTGLIRGTVTWEWPGVKGYPKSGTWGAKFDPLGCGQSSLLHPLPGTAPLCNDANLPFRYNTHTASYHLYDDYTPVCSRNQSDKCTVENVFAILTVNARCYRPGSALRYAGSN